MNNITVAVGSDCTTVSTLEEAAAVGIRMASYMASFQTVTITIDDKWDTEQYSLNNFFELMPKNASGTRHAETLRNNVNQSI